MYGVKTVSNPPTNARERSTCMQSTNVCEGSTGRYTNTRERSTCAHTIHTCTQEIHTCTQEIHMPIICMHIIQAHAIQAKASALLFLCSQNGPQILLYLLNVPVISCTTNRESFRELLLRLSFRSLNSQRRTNLSAHFIYGMNEVGDQTCAVEWRSTLRTLIYFPTLLRPMFGIL